METEISERELLAAISTPVPEIRLPSSIPVTYKGVGRSSGDAARAVKAILLNRLVARFGRSAVVHANGDSYSVAGRIITFRVTASAHRAGLPWFNVSSREVREWKKHHAIVIVIGIRPLESHAAYDGLISLLRPEFFGDIESVPTKASEKNPSALFEIRRNQDGYELLNSSAVGVAAPTDVPRQLQHPVHLSSEESRFLTAAYEYKREPDPIGTGRLRPLTLLIDPGEASNEELAELLSEISKLYRMVGGSGISFKMTDSRRPAEVAV